MDFSKTFEKIVIDKLLHNLQCYSLSLKVLLQCYGLSLKVLLRLKNFFIEGIFNVKLNNFVLKFCGLTGFVSQGSKLDRSIVIYNLFILLIEQIYLIFQN